MLSGQGNSFKEDGGRFVHRLHHSCEKEWLKKRSRVFLYRSPFWTVDENYIESYLEVRFGSDWNVPVIDEVEWRKKEQGL